MVDHRLTHGSIPDHPYHWCDDTTCPWHGPGPLEAQLVARNRQSNPLRDRGQVIRHQLARLERELAELECYPTTDPYQDGTVIRAVVRHEIDAGQEPNSYTYILTRQIGRWFSTGRTGPHRVRWAKLVEWLLSVNLAEFKQIWPPEPTTDVQANPDARLVASVDVDTVEHVIRDRFNLLFDDLGSDSDTPSKLVSKLIRHRDALIASLRPATAEPSNTSDQAKTNTDDKHGRLEDDVVRTAYEEATRG